MKDLLQTATSVLLAMALAVTAAAVGYAHGQPRVAGHIVICAGDQIVTLAIGADGQPVETHHHCPDCVVKLAAVPTAPPAIAHDLSRGRSIDRPALRQSAVSPPVLKPRARAPPVML